MILILSDLHLGAGDALDDFLLWGDTPRGPATPALRAQASLALDRSLARLLAAKLAHASAAGLLPTLVLLGDTLDLWQAQRPGEPSARATGRVIAAHAEAFVALRGWLDAGARLELVIGNHDQPLVDPRAWATLREALPGVNASNAGAPRHWIADEATGLYAEHGHQWDPHNRIRRLGKPDASPAGRRVVRRLVNPLEPKHPWIDKGATLADALLLLEETAGPDALGEAFDVLARSLGAAHRLVRAVLPWRERRPAGLDGLRAGQLAAMNRGIARALSPRPGGATGPLPARLRFLASGHTHEPLRVETRAGVERLNAGAWKPLVTRRGPGDVAVEQALPYVQLVPDGAGGHEASLHSWAREDR